MAALARGLGVDRRYLFNLALVQQGHNTVAGEIAEIFGAVVTQNEAEWLKVLREASDHSDPPVTE